MQPLRRLFVRAGFALFLGSVAPAQITVAGFTFDAKAAPDLAVPQPSSNPQFAGLSTGCLVSDTLTGLTGPESVASIFVDDGLQSWCFGKTVVRLDFVDNAVRNGPGADLVVFELGGAESFDLALFSETLCTWSLPRTYLPTATGFSQDLCGVTVNSINAASIDLTDFGVASGAAVRRIRIDNRGAYGGTVGADLALVMARNSAAPTAPMSPCLLGFQQGIDAGVGTYLGAADTCLASDFPTTAYGAAPLEFSDSSAERNLLLRFNGLVGANPGQVPPGAKIQRASLTVSTGPSGAASAGTHGVHRVLQPWNAATATWASSFGGDGVDADGAEAFVGPEATLAAMPANATQTVDVTAIVQAWADGAPNHGVAILASTADGLGLHLAEAAVETLRPALTVEVAGKVRYASAVAGFAPTIAGGEPFTCNLDPSNALGPPDTDPGVAGICCAAQTFASLGSGGSITLEFTTVSISGNGAPSPDLWIHEVGPAVEATSVELSTNLATWTSVGSVGGATSGIDLDAFGVGPLSLYRYVRLTDDPLEGSVSGCSAGADVDAVAALSPNPWVSYGASLPGVLGAPALAADDPLAAGVLIDFHLANAAPSSAAFFVFGTSALFVPFLGGTLVPNPTVVSSAVATGPTGSATLPLTWPPAVPPGVSIWVQAWVVDATAPAGLAASNAIQAVTQ